MGATIGPGCAVQIHQPIAGHMSTTSNQPPPGRRRFQLLYQISKAIHSTLDPQEALHAIVDEAVRAVGATSGWLALINPMTHLLEIHAARNLPPARREMKLRLGEGLAGRVARSGSAARLGDTTHLARNSRVHPGLRSELAVPLEVNGEVRGVLTVASRRADAFSAGDQKLLEEMAIPAAKAIHNTWIYEQFRLKVRLFEALVSVSHTINSTLGLDEILTVVTREACALMHAKMCSLMLLDPNRQWLELRASHGAGDAYVAKPRLSLEESLLGVVVRRKKPVQDENVQTSVRYQNAEVARREGLVSLLSVPLLFAGQTIGTLSVYTGHPYTFSNDEIRILSALAELSAIAIEKARLYERIVTAEEQLRQNEKLSALGLLAAEVAHEIRNPLTVMKMLYHSLDLKFPAGDPRAKDAQILGAKIDHLNKLVERVLDFARVPEPQFSPVSVNALIEELALLVRHKLNNQNIRLQCRLQPELPPVTGDAAQLEQAFLNLILNAAEAMPGGGELTIASRPSRPSSAGAAPATIAVEIADTGHGFKEPQRRRALGGVLSTTKKKGTGLGLAIVNRVVEAHHGRVKFKTHSARGTSVIVTLPAVQPVER